jgi:hypothetical protein
MTEQEAKTILLLYRPNSADADDPEFAGALELVRQSPELRDWFEKHCAVQEAIRSRLSQISVPEGLKEQIVSEYNARRVAARLQRRVMLAAVAVVVLMGVIGGFWVSSHLGLREDQSFAAYRSRMVRTVSRVDSYSMDLETNDLAQIRSYLTQRQALADWELSGPLEQTARTGCGVLKWQGRPVSMICFRSGNPLEPGQKSDLFLFVIDRKDLRDAPDRDTPQITTVNKMLTASWSASGKTYVLAIEGDEALLRRYL